MSQSEVKSRQSNRNDLTDDGPCETFGMKKKKSQHFFVPFLMKGTPNTTFIIDPKHLQHISQICISCKYERFNLIYEKKEIKSDGNGDDMSNKNESNSLFLNKFFEWRFQFYLTDLSFWQVLN